MLPNNTQLIEKTGNIGPQLYIFWGGGHDTDVRQIRSTVCQSPTSLQEGEMDGVVLPSQGTHSPSKDATVKTTYGQDL